MLLTQFEQFFQYFAHIRLANLPELMNSSKQKLLRLETQVLKSEPNRDYLWGDFRALWRFSILTVIVTLTANEILRVGMYHVEHSSFIIQWE